MPSQAHMPQRTILIFSVMLSVVALVILLSQQQTVVGDGLNLASQAGLNPPTIQAVPLQLKPGSQALALIDHDNETICLYEYQYNRQKHERLVLLATRSFKYDRQLEAFNTASPTPMDIKRLIDSSGSDEK